MTISSRFRVASATFVIYLGAASVCGAQQGEPPLVAQRIVRINGIDQYYRVYGQGPPILLLHGLTNTWRVWRPFLQDLAKDYRLIVPDLRGHGRSSNPSANLLVSQVVRDMFSLLDSLRVERASLIGYSFGGHVALRMAAQTPDRIATIISVAGAHRLIGSSRVFHVDNSKIPIGPGWWSDAVRTWHPRGLDQMNEVLRLGLTGALADSFDMPDEALARINARTLIIQGDRDEVFPLDVPFELARKIRNAQLWIIPNATHGAFFFCGLMPPPISCGGGTDAARAFPAIVRTVVPLGGA